MRGRARRIGLAVVAAAGVGLVVAPVEGRIDADVEVIDSNAVAAPVGLISRVPAESPGGAVLTSTAITLDKALARAAGFTSGELGETFFTSSSDDYRNPTLVTAQYPPTGTAPAEASGGGPPGSGVAGLHAAATDQPSASAEAAGGQSGDPAALAMSEGRSSSHGELGHDGTVVTRAFATASGITIGGVVTIASATTEAVTTVPARGEPTAMLKVTLTGLLAGGVPAELTDQGLRLSDQVPVGPGPLLAFNAALAQLAQRGITVTAAPAVREAAGDHSRAEGGAAIVRYRVADQIGGDEELVLAQARSRSTLTLAAGLTELPTPVPALPGTPPLAPPPASPARPAPRVEPGPAPVGAIDLGQPATEPLAAEAGPGGAVTAPAPPPTPLDLLGEREDPAVARLRSGYRVILLLATAGVAFHLARQRTRLT